MANIVIDKIYEQVRGSSGKELTDYKEKRMRIVFDEGRINAVIRVCKVLNNEGACKRILLTFGDKEFVPGKPIIIDEVQEAEIFGV